MRSAERELEGFALRLLDALVPPVSSTVFVLVAIPVATGGWWRGDD